MKARLLDSLGRAAGILRIIVGAPDYDRYLAHVRARHPGVQPLGWAEFYRSRLDDRYNKPGSKCC